MRLSQFLDPERIALGLAVEDKWSLIDQLVDSLPAGPAAFPVDLEHVRGCVRSREEQLTTGLEQGIALPHALIEGVPEPRGVLGVVPPGLDFESFDGEPTQFVLLMVLPDTPVGRRTHLGLLSQTIRMFTDEKLRTSVLEATCPEAVHRLVADADREQ